MILENLGIEKCLKVNLEKVTFLLDNFQINYSQDFESCNPIIQVKDRFYDIGYSNRNQIKEDLKNEGIEVIHLYSHIRDKINELVTIYLDECYMQNRNVETFYEDSLNRYSLDRIGKNPLTEIYKRGDYHFDLSNISQGIIGITNCCGNLCMYNIVKDLLYIDDEYINLEEQNRQISKKVLFSNDTIEYILYRKYINNELQGEELAYKQIADLNKWFENKKMITMIYEDKNKEVKEKKVQANTTQIFNDLPRRYYKEMFNAWEVDNISQIKSFKYGKEEKEFDYKLFLWKEREVEE